MKCKDRDNKDREAEYY